MNSEDSSEISVRFLDKALFARNCRYKTMNKKIVFQTFNVQNINVLHRKMFRTFLYGSNPYMFIFAVFFCFFSIFLQTLASHVWHLYIVCKDIFLSANFNNKCDYWIISHLCVFLAT